MSQKDLHDVALFRRGTLRMRLKTLYVIRYRAGNGEAAVTVRYHLPKVGSLWMMEECNIQEVTLTGKAWTYDRKARRLRPSEAKRPALPKERKL